MTAELQPLQLGLFLLAAGMAVVFGALLTLMFALKVMRRLDERAAPVAAATAAAPAIHAVEPDVSGVLLAAIATTLLLDAQQVEEEERLVLTMRALPKPYSNWWQGRMARAEMWRPQVTQTRADALRTPQPHPDRHV